MKSFKILPKKQICDLVFSFLALGILLYAGAGEILRIPSGRMIDFKHFYYAAEALVSHHNLYSSGTGGYIYPPFFAFLIIPLTCFSYPTAALIWLIINLILIFAILWWGFQTLAKCFNLTFTISQAIGACSLAILLTYDPLRWELLLGQSDTVILAGFALALVFMTRYPFLAGVILGATFNVKYLALGFLPFFLLRARFKTIFGLLTGSLGFAFLPAILTGWKTNLDNLAIAFRGLFFMANPGANKLSVAYAARVPSIDWHLNITITSGLFRVLTHWGLNNVAIFFSIVAFVLIVLTIFGRIFLKHGIPFIWRTPQTLGDSHKESQIFTLEWYLLFVCILIFSPQNTTRHLFLLLSVHLFAAVLILFPKAGVKTIPLLISIFIMQIGMGLHIGALWQFWSGACWSILPFIIIFTDTALTYILAPTDLLHVLNKRPLAPTAELFDAAILHTHKH